MIPPTRLGVKPLDVVPSVHGRYALRGQGCVFPGIPERTLSAVPRGAQWFRKEGRQQTPASGRKLGTDMQARIPVGLGDRRKVQPCCLDDVIVITGLQNYW